MEGREKHSAFTKWLARYGRAWEEGDSEAVIELFTSDAVYHEVPFEEPMVGADAIRRYWDEGASRAQKDITFSFTVLSFQNNQGIAHWRAQFQRVPSGINVELDGILIAAFSVDGRCQNFREWWHRKETNDGVVLN